MKKFILIGLSLFMFFFKSLVMANYDKIFYDLKKACHNKIADSIFFTASSDQSNKVHDKIFNDRGVGSLCCGWVFA